MKTETVDSLRAAISVQQNLSMALFAATENKNLVIEFFSGTTEHVSSHALYSDMTDVFYEEFERQQELVLMALRGIREESSG